LRTKPGLAVTKSTAQSREQSWILSEWRIAERPDRLISLHVESSIAQRSALERRVFRSVVFDAKIFCEILCVLWSQIVSDQPQNLDQEGQTVSTPANIVSAEESIQADA